MGRSAVGAIITVTVAGAVLLSGFLLLPPLLDLGDMSGHVDSHARLNGAGTWADVAGEDSWGKNETVVDSRGYAIHTSGASDSYVTTDGRVDVGGDTTWTVQQAVAIDDSATDQQVVVLAIGDPDLLLLYDNSTGTANWSAVYYSTTESYRVNVSAPTPTARTHVYAIRNGSTFKIRVNNTTGESTSIDGDGAPTGDLTTAEGCPCWLEETRAWDDVLNDSQLEQTQTQPVAPLAANQTLRIMYDRGSGNEVLVFWASTQTATASNATWVDGYDGRELSRDGLLGGDYKWSKRGPELKPVSGGDLDGAPVAWVSYDRQNPTQYEIQERVVNALLVGGLVLVVLMVAVVLRVLKEV